MVLEGRRSTWSGNHAELVEGARLLVGGEPAQAQRSFVSAEHGTHDRLVSLMAGLGAGCAPLRRRPPRRRRGVRVDGPGALP